MNKTYIPIAPDKPIALNERQVLTYVPKLAYSNPGVMKFTAEHFVVTNGEVQINAQSTFNPRILISPDEPTLDLDSVQMWYKVIGSIITEPEHIKYPVTWKYANGNVAKTEYLVSGSVSNAPPNTTWTNYVMYYWPSQSYTITQALIITEQFAEIIRSYSSSSYDMVSSITLGELTDISILDEINYYVLLTEIRNIYGNALISYTMDSSINVGDDTNIGTLTDGLNYYILSSGDWQKTISLILSLNYSIEGNEMVGNTETVLSLLDSINYYIEPTIVQGRVVYESADLNYNVSSTITSGIVYNEILSVYIPYVTTKVSDIESYTYTVTFKNWNGTTLKTVTNVAYDGYAAPPSTNPTRTGYTFAGWNSSAYQVVTQNETITATYTARKYTVNFNEMGGSTVDNMLVTYDSTYGPLPTPTNSLRELVGWYTSTAYTTQVTSETTVTTANNHTLYAQWTLFVTFEYNYYTPQTTQSVAYGGKATGFTPTRAGYTFGGWYTNYNLNVGYNFNDPIAEDRTLYAKWTPKTYTVTWNRYNGVPVRVDENVAYGTVKNAPLTGSTDEHDGQEYTFSWPVSSVTVTKDETITEVRTAVVYTVVWKSYAGVTLKTDTLNYGQTSTAPTGTADNATWDYSWPKSSHTVPYSTTITETRTALSKYWASSTVNVYNLSPNKLTFQDAVEILNPSYDGCATVSTLLALLPDANSYSGDTVARVNVYGGYPQTLCSTWKYFKVSSGG